MRTILLTTLLLLTIIAKSQNVKDNSVSFQYTQLPLLKIQDAFMTYETRVNHAYLASNEDSVTLFNTRKQVAAQQYEAKYAQYVQKKNTLLVSYYQQMATWEQNNNAGKVDAQGNAYPKPLYPTLPSPPIYDDLKALRLNSVIDDATIKKGLSIEGFTEGLGGSILTVDIQAIRNIRIVEKKNGSGASTRYKYHCEYVLPILIKFETPTDGILLQEVILQNKQIYNMKEQKSRYAHMAYILQNENQFYTNLEITARNKALKAANSYINNQLGYIKKTRKTEVYSVKKFKNFDYSDVTNAYSTTVSALQIVGKDLDHSLAKKKLETALAQWNEIFLESNDYDKKARINDKITAVIQCNVAEILFWLNQFDKNQSMLNLAENSSVLKAKNHARSQRNFYAGQKTRWDVHF